MRLREVACSLLAVMASLQIAVADNVAQKVTTVAVVSPGIGNGSVIGDLLTVELASIDHLALVERDQISAALRNSNKARRRTFRMSLRFESGRLWMTVRSTAPGNVQPHSGLWTCRFDQNGDATFQPVGKRLNDCSGVIPNGDWLVFHSAGGWRRVHRETHEIQQLDGYLPLHSSGHGGKVPITKRRAIVSDDEIITAGRVSYHPDGKKYRLSNNGISSDIFPTADGFLLANHMQLFPGVSCRLWFFERLPDTELRSSNPVRLNP